MHQRNIVYHIGIWQHGQYLLCRDSLIVTTYCAKTFCNGPLPQVTLIRNTYTVQHHKAHALFLTKEGAIACDSNQNEISCHCTIQVWEMTARGNVWPGVM